VSSEEEKNKALARRFLEATVRVDLDVLDELLAPDFVDHSLMSGQEPGREGRKRFSAEIIAPFSNMSLTIEDQIAVGDKVVTRYTVRATHDRGEIWSVPPTGRRHTFTGISIHRTVGCKIAEEWSEREELDIVQPALEQEIRERERIGQELRAARRIQQASLPKEVPTLEGWQISPYYRPAREVGGDFYDFHLLSGDRVGLVVGDATGKGMPAALMMSTTRGMLRAVVQSVESPGEVLARVNEALVADMPPSTFVTCFYGVLDPKSGHLVYANAEHDLPYLYRRSGAAEELRARGMPLGLMPDMSYEEKGTILQAGDSALFYSDGLVEAHDPKDEMFGFPRLRTLVAEHGEERSLGNFLLEELYSFVGEGWEQEDDITLLTLERSPIRS